MIEAQIKKWNARFGLEVPAAHGEKEALQWLMIARLGIAYGVLIVVVLHQLLRRSYDPSWILAYTLLAGVFAFNFAMALAMNRAEMSARTFLLHILFDAFCISVWISKGGAIGVVFFLVQILVVALTFFQKGAIFCAFVASFSLGFVKWKYGLGNISEWAIYSGLFLALGFVGGFLSEELLKTTERLKEKSRTIEKLTALHDKIISSIPTGLLTIDRNMRVNFINPSGEQILNRSSKELVGKHLGEVEPELLPFFTQIQAEHLEEETAEEAAVSATGTEHHRSLFLESKKQSKMARLQQTVEIGRGSSYRMLRGDVAELEPEAGIGKLLDEKAHGGRVLLFQDVTKLIHLEEKLKQNEKLAAVGQLAAGIAHEIRNPLASMSASIEMLKASKELQDGENQKLMEIAIREIDRLNRLISEFLDFVKPEKIKRVPVKISDVLSQILSSVRTNQELSRGIEIVENYDAQAIVLGSEEKLKQVIWNFVLNALQAMKGTGKLLVGARPLNEYKTVFWVEDTGEGMSEEVLHHLYEPFFTTKDKGTGLGLATAYKVIEAHQGEIKVTSHLGKGTKFEIILPRAEE